MRRKGKRNRERQARPKLLKVEWWYKGRTVVVFEIDQRGFHHVTTKVPKWRVNEVYRELAAEWLRQYMPKLTHDERYYLIWG